MAKIERHNELVTVDRNFVAKHLATGFASFVAPAVGLWSAVKLASKPQVDMPKAVARMRHADIENAPLHQLVSKALSKGLDSRAILHQVNHAVETQAASRRPRCHP